MEGLPMNWDYVLGKLSRLLISAVIIFGAVLGVMSFIFAAFMAGFMCLLFLEAVQYGFIAGLTVAIHGIVLVGMVVFVGVEMFQGVIIAKRRKLAKSSDSRGG